MSASVSYSQNIVLHGIKNLSVTVSYLHSTSQSAGSAAKTAAIRKESYY